VAAGERASSRSFISSASCVSKSKTVAVVDAATPQLQRAARRPLPEPYVGGRTAAKTSGSTAGPGTAGDGIGVGAIAKGDGCSPKTSASAWDKAGSWDTIVGPGTAVGPMVRPLFSGSTACRAALTLSKSAATGTSGASPSSGVWSGSNSGLSVGGPGAWAKRARRRRSPSGASTRARGTDAPMKDKEKAGAQLGQDTCRSAHRGAGSPTDHLKNITAATNPSYSSHTTLLRQRAWAKLLHDVLITAHRLDPLGITGPSCSASTPWTDKFLTGISQWPDCGIASPGASLNTWGATPTTLPWSVLQGFFAQRRHSWTRNPSVA
jgi:hypothetical protein